MKTEGLRARARAHLYGFLARAFRSEDETFGEALDSGGCRTRLASAAAVLDPANLAEPVRRALCAAEQSKREERESARIRAFGFTLRGTVPPYELEYGRSDVFQMSQELADLAGFYRAFGMEMDPESNERADHIAAELEYMLLLSAHQTQAEEEAEHEGLEHLAVSQDAQRKFLRDHLGRWGIGFGRRMAAFEAGGFLGECGTLLAEFLASDCRALGVAHGPQHLELRETGSAEELIAAQNCDASLATHDGGGNEAEAG